MSVVARKHFFPGHRLTLSDRHDIGGESPSPPSRSTALLFANFSQSSAAFSELLLMTPRLMTNSRYLLDLNSAFDGGVPTQFAQDRLLGPSQSVPEPGTPMLFGVGALGVLARVRRRRKQP
jgi:hypothetical protein